jgi:predicted DNA-binding protein with PD1-like motif
MTFLEVKILQKNYMMNIENLEGDLWIAKKIENSYVVNIKDQSSLKNAFTDFLMSQQISDGKITGMGNVNEIILRFYNPLNKEFFDVKFNEIATVSEVSGSFSKAQEKVIFNLEIVLERENHTALTGGFVDAKINGMNTFFLFPMKSEVIKTEKFTDN